MATAQALELKISSIEDWLMNHEGVLVIRSFHGDDCEYEAQLSVTEGCTSVDLGDVYSDVSFEDLLINIADEIERNSWNEL